MYAGQVKVIQKKQKFLFQYTAHPFYIYRHEEFQPVLEIFQVVSINFIAFEH
jgi:hypothetical protein